ncbi:flagellar motor protein MotB [Microbacterium sp. ARD32]|uniref:OmpA/MotB family protein n=1 Tax=Microbacterium sp. ARD32 TaxID=2962577 RepID=UPI00288210DC|nr:flagellar motor protein MotB [Microbacterium sp. ARD32]MDT0156362.1 flagellar motor protein MotB [Microbacterium sp. ARD32]
MSVRRRRRIESEGHEGPDERWMASYMDMITVLMCMFIVLFSMSTIDLKKFNALSESLATGFGQEQTEKVDVSAGVIVPAHLLDEDGEDSADIEVSAAQKELDDLSALRDRIRTALSEQGLADTATFTIDSRGLTISLVSAETFFATNSTTLSGIAVNILNTLGGVLASIPNEISIEGHADTRQSAAPFATNWELSAARATQVLRHLVEVCGISPGVIKSVGYGDARPVAKGTSAEALAQNRRVDVVVLSDADEGVRQLLPALQAKAPSR